MSLDRICSHIKHHIILSRSGFPFSESFPWTSQLFYCPAEQSIPGRRAANLLYTLVNNTYWRDRSGEGEDDFLTVWPTSGCHDP